MCAGARRRTSNWLLCDQDGLEAWLAGLVQRTEAKKGTPLHPVIAEFRDLIDHDPVVRMYMTEMVAQIPKGRKYRKGVDLPLTSLSGLFAHSRDFVTPLAS